MRQTLILGSTIALLLTAGCSSSSGGGSGGASSSAGNTSSGGSVSASGNTSSGGSSTSSSGTSSGGNASANGGTSSVGNSGSDSGGSTSSAGASGGPVGIAGGITDIRGLTVVGSSLYWIEGVDSPTGAIMSVPVTGGTPKPVLMNTHLRGDLASDGTLLYFTCDPNTPTGELDSVGLDGSNEQPVTTVSVLLGHASPASELFLVGSTLYFAASLSGLNTVASVSTSGGTAAAVIPQGAAGGVLELVSADSSGLYFQFQGGGPQTLAYAPITGGAPVTVYTPTGIPVEPLGGDFAVSGGAGYFIIDNNGTDLMKFTPPSGAAISVKKLTVSENSSGLVADSLGAFELEAGGDGGLYSVDLSTGVQTLVTTANGSLTKWIAVLDSKNIYFAEGSNSIFSLLSLAR